LQTLAPDLVVFQHGTCALLCIITASPTDEEIRAEIDRCYDVVRERLPAVWAAVVEELERADIEEVLMEFDLLRTGLRFK
jgi:hypothetical protein